MSRWRLGCALLIGAAVAFPLGVIVGAGERGDPPAAFARPARSASQGRRVYSPDVLRDPYVLDQQRKVVEALERQCRHFNERCEEAANARQSLDR